jgi:hypothetical protein
MYGNPFHCGDSQVFWIFAESRVEPDSPTQSQSARNNGATLLHCQPTNNSYLC